MKKQIRNFNLTCLSLLLTYSLLFTSCESIELVDTQSFVDESIEKLQSKVIGKSFCFELIFPVSIVFNDQSTAEVTSYENLYETILAYYEDNGTEPNLENRPDFIYPIDVVSEEGEVISVSSFDELLQLKDECPKIGKGKGRKGRGFKCFSLIFPISIDIGGEIFSFENKIELREAIKAYKELAGEEAERPNLIFPITVEFDDGTILEIENAAVLQELKDNCKEEN